MRISRTGLALGTIVGLLVGRIVFKEMEVMHRPAIAGGTVASVRVVAAPGPTRPDALPHGSGPARRIPPPAAGGRPGGE